MPETASRSARLETRIAPDTLQLARRAAEIEGRSLSDYVATALDAAARRTIEETHTIRLSAEEQRAFVDMLLNPPPPTEALRRAKAYHEQLIGPV